MVGHNVGAANPDPAGTARALAASGADVLALEELIPQTTGTYEKELAKTYPYHTVLGTVGLWSKLPLSDTQPIDIMNYGPLADTIPADRRWPRTGRCAPRWPRTTGRWRCTWPTWGPYG